MENKTIELGLSETLDQIDAGYREIDLEFDRLLGMASDSEWSGQSTEQILDRLEDVRRLSRMATETRTRLSGRGTTAAEESQFHQVTQLFHKMLAKISVLERAAQNARDQLLPQVTESVRSIQMQRAYSPTLQEPKST